MTREDWKITFPKSRARACPARLSLFSVPIRTDPYKFADSPRASPESLPAAYRKIFLFFLDFSFAIGENPVILTPKMIVLEQ